MSHYQKLVARLAAILSAVILAACGGGGGGGGSSSVAYLEITPGNAAGVASAVIETVVSSLDVADAGGSDLGASPADVAAGVGALAVSRYLPHMRRHALGLAQPLASVGPIDEPCLESGFITLSGNVADPETLSVGDRILADFNFCNDGDGSVIDGRLALVIRAYEFDLQTGGLLIRADVDLTNFVVTDSEGEISADGGFELTLDGRSPPTVLTRIVGASLEIAYGGDSFTLEDFDESSEFTADVVPFRNLITAVGTLISSLLDGKVDYGTTTPVEGPAGDAPDDGVILITGANGATIRVVVLDQSTVELRLDLDGNGTVDEVQTTSWAELGGAVAPGVTANNARAIVREALGATAQFGITARDAGAQFGSDGAFYTALAQITVPGAFGPLSFLCQASTGPAIVTGQLAVLGDFSVGDQFSGVYSGCLQASPPGQFPIGSISVSGSLETTVTSYSGFGGFFAVGVDGVFDDFNGVTGEFTATYDRSDPTTIAYSSASAAVQMTGLGARALNAVSVEASINSFVSPSRLTRSFAAEMYTALVPGRYTIATQTPLVSDGDNDLATGPDTGEFTVTADNGSAVTVVAVALANYPFSEARFDLDLDGNGSIDEVLNVAWAELVP